MNKGPFLIKQIQQKDNHTFSILWSDGLEQDIRLSNLQRQCPCANCMDEKTGERLLNLNAVKDDVKAISIKSVGRYALQVQFTSGCSTGIYSFEILRQKLMQRSTKNSL